MQGVEANEIAGIRVLVADAAGDPVGTERDANDVLSACFSAGADWFAVPVERLDFAFFDLATRQAGLFVEKLQTYGIRLAIVGDVSGHEARSGAFRDWVREANRGRGPVFVRDLAELEKRLG